ncbi:MAG: NAD(P)/FAD-dependent oxidoreductase [Candidatus Krumholzibacteria bacterium]|nr:NAD(P)/FAD-dependent oxidoreductase [Candidatus Krumholzibacteria bacterium]
MFDLDVTVVGGGIVGCAVAMEVSKLGLSTALLEMESGLARGTTSRNSEVSHGGMYYPTGSLKARYCVEGRRLLKEFCGQAGVDYQECGKVIVAVDDTEILELERLLALGQANGVEDLRLIGAAELAAMEPDVRAKAGLFSPRTAIFDAEGAARAYARMATERGAQVLSGSRVTGLERFQNGWEVTITPTGDRRREGWRHTSRIVINAAGLWADRVAALAGIDIEGRGWVQHLTKGNYFAVNNAHDGRIKSLIYPVPPAEGTSLGVHVCLDLAGQMKLGPDLETMMNDPRDTNTSLVDFDLDYRVDPRRQASFYEDAKRFLPWLEFGDLTPAMCGFRPKLAVTGFEDFAIRRESDDFGGLINLVGIESPGLTSAPAIAVAVADLVREMEQ